MDEKSDYKCAVFPNMIFLTFLKLGCYSFGGPAAHLGYFYEEFVRRKGWLEENEWGEIIAFTQLLPGPGSSQTGFLIGVLRGGLWGGLQAWLGFTLPSATLLILFAAGVDLLRSPAAEAAMRGLQIAAIAVVANAVRLMHRQLSPDGLRSIFALSTLILVLALPASVAQIAAIIAAGIGGALFLNNSRTAPPSKLHLPISRRSADAALLLFAFLFVALEALSRFTSVESIQVLRAFYQSGALVFGGGHVVLPLLQQTVVRPGWVSEPDFLTGYGAAQTIPGPLFTFAAYLGYLLSAQPNKIAGALMCLTALFLPGILLVIGLAPYWRWMQGRKRARSALAGINAGVVGLLAAALVKIIMTTPSHDPLSVCLVVLNFVLLWSGRVSPLVVAAGSAAVCLLAHSILTK